MAALKMHNERLPRAPVNWELQGGRPFESCMKEVKRNMVIRELQEEDI